MLSADGMSFTDGLPVADAAKLVTANAGSQIRLEIVPAALVRSETEPLPAAAALAPPTVADEKSPDDAAAAPVDNPAHWSKSTPASPYAAG